MGHATSHRMVAELLHELGYSLQANRKTIEGKGHPDRNAQFEHIKRKVQAALKAGEPVISVDAKKKELVGDFKNAGREWQPEGHPEPVRVYDFIIPALGRVTPYGIYDMARNAGWVNVGTDHDTAAFAVESIRRWWDSMGQATLPRRPRRLADHRRWRREQRVAGAALEAWNSSGWPTRRGWRSRCATSRRGRASGTRSSIGSSRSSARTGAGKPLVSHEVIVNLIAATTTKTGLKVTCELDRNSYPSGIKVSKKDMEGINLQRDAFHGEWNYTLLPRLQS